MVICAFVIWKDLLNMWHKHGGIFTRPWIISSKLYAEFKHSQRLFESTQLFFAHNLWRIKLLSDMCWTSWHSLHVKTQTSELEAADILWSFSSSAPKYINLTMSEWSDVITQEEILCRIHHQWGDMLKKLKLKKEYKDLRMKKVCERAWLKNLLLCCSCVKVWIRLLRTISRVHVRRRLKTNVLHHPCVASIRWCAVTGHSSSFLCSGYCQHHFGKHQAEKNPPDPGNYLSWLRNTTFLVSGFLFLCRNPVGFLRGSSAPIGLQLGCLEWCGARGLGMELLHTGPQRNNRAYLSLTLSLTQHADSLSVSLSSSRFLSYYFLLLSHSALSLSLSLLSFSLSLSLFLFPSLAPLFSPLFLFMLFFQADWFE